MSTSGHLHRRREQLVAELAKQEPPLSWNRCIVGKEMWRVVRRLTPAEGLALVCLTSWVEEESGLVQASDRQVCSEIGVSRDVLKPLRRKMGAIGIQVTPGNNLSHDSYSYDFRKVLKIQVHERAQPGAKSADGVPPAVRPPAPPQAIPMPLSGLSGPSSARDAGATPKWEATAGELTVEIGYAGIEFEVDLPSEWDDELEKQVDSRKAPRGFDQEEPVPRPLPPYEQWLARR